LVSSRYTNDALRRALQDEFGARTLKQLHESGKKVLVTAFCTTTGRPRVFKTDHSENLTLHGGLHVWEVALASASAPVYFPLSRIINPANHVVEEFCDGGVAANHPALLAFAEAVSELRVVPRRVRLLSLATPRTGLGEPIGVARRSRGLMRWSGNLFSILIDANSMMAHEVLNRLVTSYGSPGPLYSRQNMLNRARLPFDRADAFATNELMATGASAAADRQVRERLKPMFNL
jgi:uncharacterized protein